MRIAIASDHAGFHFKTILTKALQDAGHEVRDFGTDSEVPCDYPDFIMPAARAVAAGECERGIVLGGSGNGEAMAANRIRKVRCALCWNEETARMARTHNDANMLAMGERLITELEAVAIMHVWLTTPFEGGRHLRRIQKLDT
jgi:ribose 5-phosphate isomerase B